MTTDHRYRVGGWEERFEQDLISGKYHSSVSDISVSGTQLQKTNCSFVKALTSLSVPVSHRLPYPHRLTAAVVPRVEKPSEKQVIKSYTMC